MIWTSLAEAYTLCMLSSCVYFVVIYEILYRTFATKLIWRKTDQRDDNHADAYRLSFLGVVIVDLFVSEFHEIMLTYGNKDVWNVILRCLCI